MNQTNTQLTLFRPNRDKGTFLLVSFQIEVLPEIVRAVGHKVEVYLDGGIRSGTDVLKALALGAKMVFIGRPAIWGLACGVNIEMNNTDK